MDRIAFHNFKLLDAEKTALLIASEAGERIVAI
jgi:hypothetical protein